MTEPLSYGVACGATEGERVAGVVVHRGGVMKVVLGAGVTASAVAAPAGSPGP
ncbi:hypothetical protein AB0O75_39545 [Streptomyces sp. NPDC088921]|uniref:hypothetical protein n=1 Tax=unclassified Streptomyces TaxID=2593676 RepID=UPI003427C341